MSNIFNIVDDAVVIGKLILDRTSGTISHSGSLSVAGDVNFKADLQVAGTITADTLNVKHLVTENGALGSIGNWKYDTEIELNGKGLTWAWADTETKLIFRTGNRIWSNATLDLVAGAAYSIDDVAVLTADSLGDTVTKSQLTQVGTLQTLAVSGDVELAEFAFFNSTYNRFGIGTDEPQAAISILENNIEIIMGSPASNVAIVGTYSNHDFSIVTDSIQRIKVNGGGDVEIPGSLTIHGTLFADTIQTDNRINRTHPLEFKATADTSIYGLGLMWSGTGRTRQLTMMAGPDRLWTSESLDIGAGQSYLVNGKEVINASGLGTSIVSSSLTTLGTLETLTVSGNAVFQGPVTASELAVGKLIAQVVSGVDKVTVELTGQQAFYADADQISIGDSRYQHKAVKVFGSLSVGIKNPDPSLNFSVDGDVNIGGKRFTNGGAAPSTGTYHIGDICWNLRPQASSYIGWVCIVSGDPGEWSPFGAITT